MVLKNPIEAPERLTSLALPVIAAGVVLAVLYLGRVFFITLVTATILAFMLDPAVALLMRLRIRRGLASFAVCAFAGLLFWLGLVGAYNQLSTLTAELPKYSENVAALVDDVEQRIEHFKDVTTGLIKRTPKPPPPAPAPKHERGKRVTVVMPAVPGAIPEVRIHDDRNPLLDYLYARLGTLYQYLLMASFVPVLVYFMLSWRDHLHRNFLQFFSGQQRVVASQSLQGVAGLVRAFVAGNFLLGVVLAAATVGGLYWVRLPYALLAGSISGLLSLVPYIGLPLALIVPVAVAMAAGNFSSLAWVVVIVIVLHLVAMNVLYPVIVGSRVHLNPLVVTIALMFWGFLWDAAGLLLAIPMTAGIKAVCDNVQVLRPIGRFLGD